MKEVYQDFLGNKTLLVLFRNSDSGMFQNFQKATVVEYFDFTKEDFIKKSFFLRTKLNLLLLILSEYKRIK